MTSAPTTDPKGSPRPRPRLLDPDTCRACGARGRVINTRRYPEYRRRRHECPCCGRRWNSYETRLNPRKIHLVEATHTTGSACG
mgnify:CR=1 FL=1